MPSISVIVPVYKVEPYIHRCVESIFAQTFTDFELILVDDGSPDNCGSICDDYATKDNRVTVIHQDNGGLSDARNAGIDWAFANSGSEWLTFIDSDDWVHPMYLEVLYCAVKDTGCSISVCGYNETDGETPYVDEAKLQAEVVNTEDFYCEHNVNAVVAWGKLYKKVLFSFPVSQSFLQKLRVARRQVVHSRQRPPPRAVRTARAARPRVDRRLPAVPAFAAPPGPLRAAISHIVRRQPPVARRVPLPQQPFLLLPAAVFPQRHILPSRPLSYPSGRCFTRYTF